MTASYASYALADITRNINNTYLDTVSKIWSCAAGWQYDDSNATGLPVGYTTITNATQAIVIPTTARRVYGVSVRDTSGELKKLTQIDANTLGEDPQYYDNGYGMPTGYDMVGNYIRLYPTPTSSYCTLASGMAVYFDREPTLFTTSSTTAEPGFPAPFHKILSYGAAIDFVQDKATQDRLVAMKARLENQMISFYSHRNVERKSSIRINKNFHRYK